MNAVLRRIVEKYIDFKEFWTFAAGQVEEDCESN
jgi:hypothetical protein